MAGWRLPHNPRDVVPDQSAPIVFSMANAREMRQALGTSNQKKRRNIVNFALKFVRKACTDRAGQPVTLSVDITDKPQWMVPQFRYLPRRPGVKGGQEGEVDFANVVELDWHAVAAQLPDEAWDAVFGLRSCGAEGGVVQVSFEVVGEEGHWWTKPHASNFDLIFWTRDCRVQIHPHKDEQKLTWKRFELLEEFSSATSSPSHQASGECKGPGGMGFLHGGAEDDEFLSNMRERAGMDSGVRWWPAPVWERLQVLGTNCLLIFSFEVAFFC